MILVFGVFLSACASTGRMTVDDLSGQSFESTLQALKYARCPFVVYSEGLAGSPPLREDAVLEMANDGPTGWNQFYGKVERVVEIAPGIWLFAGPDGSVIGGIDEEAYVRAFCEPDDERKRAVSS